jgi:hypothetical protein
MLTVQTKVAEQLASLSPKVEEKVVEALTKRELDKRSEAVVKVLDFLSRLEIDSKKLGPDLLTFDAEGKRTSEAYSKSRTEERKKTNERIEKLTKSLIKALDNNDYGDLYSLAKEQSPKDQKESGGES